MFASRGGCLTRFSHYVSASARRKSQTNSPARAVSVKALDAVRCLRLALVRLRQVALEDRLCHLHAHGGIIMQGCASSTSFFKLASTLIVPMPSCLAPSSTLSRSSSTRPAPSRRPHADPDATTSGVDSASSCMARDLISLPSLSNKVTNPKARSTASAARPCRTTWLRSHSPWLP